MLGVVGRMWRWRMSSGRHCDCLVGIGCHWWCCVVPYCENNHLRYCSTDFHHFPQHFHDDYDYDYQHHSAAQTFSVDTPQNDHAPPSPPHTDRHSNSHNIHTWSILYSLAWAHDWNTLPDCHFRQCDRRDVLRSHRHGGCWDCGV